LLGGSLLLDVFFDFELQMFAGEVAVELFPFLPTQCPHLISLLALDQLPGGVEIILLEILVLAVEMGPRLIDFLQIVLNVIRQLLLLHRIQLSQTLIRRTHYIHIQILNALKHFDLLRNIQAFVHQFIFRLIHYIVFKSFMYAIVRRVQWREVYFSF